MILKSTNLPKYESALAVHIGLVDEEVIGEIQNIFLMKLEISNKKTLTQ